MEQLIEDDESKVNPNEKTYSIRVSTTKSRCFRLFSFIILLSLNIASVFFLVKQISTYSSYYNRLNKLKINYANITQSIRKISNSIQIQNDLNMEFGRELSVLESNFNTIKKTLSTLELQQMAIKTIYNKPQSISKLIKQKQSDILELRTKIDEISAFKITTIKQQKLNSQNVLNKFISTKEELQRLSRIVGSDIKGVCYNSRSDGYSGKKFYELCSHYQNIAIVIHHHMTNIFGGFIPFKINSENGKIFLNEVFLFNLNKEKIYNVKSGQYSIEIKENAFPIFGKNDIYLDPVDKSLSFSDFPNNFMSNESDGLNSLTDNIKNFNECDIEAILM